MRQVGGFKQAKNTETPLRQEIPATAIQGIHNLNKYRTLTADTF